MVMCSGFEQKKPCAVWRSLFPKTGSTVNTFMEDARISDVTCAVIFTEIRLNQGLISDLNFWPFSNYHGILRGQRNDSSV